MGTKSTSQVDFVDRDPTNDTIEPNPASTESLNLMFTLGATDQADLMLPLDEGKVEVWVTMAPTEKPDIVDATLSISR